MKGLLIKDAYVLKKYCKAFFVIDIIFIIVSLFGSGEETVFFLVYPCITSGILGISLISFDEREKWDTYSQTFPYTRAQTVSSKYLMGLCVTAVITLIIGVVQAIKMTITGTFVFGDYIAVISFLLTVSLLVPTFLYPMIFRLGAEKGRIFYYIMTGIICGVCAFSGKIILDFIVSIKIIPSLIFPITAVLCPILGFVGAFLQGARTLNRIFPHNRKTALPNEMSDESV